MNARAANACRLPDGRLLALALLVSSMAAPDRAAAAPDVGLAAHRASYELSLDSVEGHDTVAASGHMNYQVSDACTSWATQQQLRLRTVSRDGTATDLVSDYATLESKDGRHLAFDMKQRANGVVTQQVRGDATVDASGAGRVRYTMPQRATVGLPPGTLFPMAHTAAIIHAARAGQRSIAPTLFDGTGPDGAQDTYVTILGWHPPPSRSSRPELAGLGSSRVDVGFFSRASGTITPDYESAMRYFDNGIADDLTMNFGGFTMRGDLRMLTLPQHPSRC